MDVEQAAGSGGWYDDNCDENEDYCHLHVTYLTCVLMICCNVVLIPSLSFLLGGLRWPSPLRILLATMTTTSTGTKMYSCEEIEKMMK